ncbi:MAG TPA: LuxR C-terminal-related transcriptional regulator [Trinickia sp.]|uniref:helix-turn-helix transcriptional regulator n=1 Tax=Trinickia sp. TaxID=2571163 RepID=UPI002BC31AF3|nr:LuxR C-terminal-related transcriptional regulator [Trinickia sp.]HVW51126.1 LuxR C-terminal-related transcriptional regulator [Trinickia sp.]
MIDASSFSFHQRTPDVRRRIVGMMSCTSELSAVTELASVVELMGFDYYYYAGNFSIRPHSNVHRIFSNSPTTNEHLRTTNEQNPIIQAAQLSMIPIICGDFLQALRVQNVGCNQNEGDDATHGIIFPIHAQYGRVSALGLFAKTEHNDCTLTLAASLGEASLAAMFFHDAMTRILTKSQNQLEVLLTHREKECLRWIAHHKSNWDISRILGVSEHTIVYYVRRLMQKLGAQNRHDAVERARAHALI